MYWTIVPGLDSVVASDLSLTKARLHLLTDFLFQGMFAATAANNNFRCSCRKRIKINSFILIAILYVTIVYPIVGSWQWGDFLAFFL